MRAKNSPPSWIVLCVNAVVLMVAWGRTVVASPMEGIAATTSNFHAVVQQQNFFTVLTSIEERLRNLDNIYSMQLSQTFEGKLDQYNRRLEALDAKILRLESLVMFNLDKISENISTKNFKDDMAKTNILQKMDSVYEAINHRLGDMERKYETNLGNIETTVDSTLTKLEKIEETIMTRDSDIEAELSDVIYAVDDLKTTTNAMEQKLYNATTATQKSIRIMSKSMQSMNIDTRKAMNALHDNIIETLQFMNNRSARHFKLVEDTNIIVKAMRTELKDDFNDYANKVSDMSSYIWKNQDSAQDDLKKLDTNINSTRVEIQNGLRALMVQIGKSIKNGTIPLGNNSLDEINTNLNTNFQKILTNQDMFLESCHRLQMDESQIESEISDMLEKLIDMLEKNCKTDSQNKDIRDVEKMLKAHDNRIGRNIYQINTNVISLFEKFTNNKNDVRRDIEKIDNDVNALFAFVQSTALSESSSTINTKVLQNKLSKLENIVTDLSTSQATNNYVTEQIQKISQTLSSIESQLNNTLKLDQFMNIIKNLTANDESKDIKNATKTGNGNNVIIGDDIKQIIEDIFGTNSNITRRNVTVKANTKCKPNYRNLIDIRLGMSEGCQDAPEKPTGKKKRPYLIDVRSDFRSEEHIEYDGTDDGSQTTTEDVTVDEYSTTELTTAMTNEDVLYNLAALPNDTV